MLKLRKSKERGYANHGWLESFHSFSFADFYDPEHMGWGPLRVINEDFIEAGKGFDTHPHRDMEIITYVIEGALEHKDSMGNLSRIEKGDVQRMTAGSGVQHSEYSANKVGKTHMIQIWIKPLEMGLRPSYEQKAFSDELKKDRLLLIASKEGRESSIKINQEADLYASKLSKESILDFVARPQRHIWLQLINGALTVNGIALGAGDALGIVEEDKIKLTASKDSEFILFDLV